MGRFNWTAAKTGKRSGGGTGGFVSNLQFEIGEFKRVVIPALIDPETGEESPIIFQEPVHNLNGDIFVLQGPKGTPYTPYQIRCMNPLSQTDDELVKKIVERKQYCIPCLMASLADKEYFAEMDKEFGSLDEYKAASSEQKKAFNNRMKDKPRVRASYDSQKGKTYYAMEMLMLEMETESRKEKDEFGIESDVTTPVLGEDGLPKYKPVLFKVSEARLDKFSAAVKSALKAQSITGAHIHKLEENGEQVLTTFIDFELDFPQKDSKMKSAAEMTIRAVRADETVITPEFISKVQGDSESLIEKAEKAFKRSNANLQEFTNDDYKNAFKDGGARYDELKSKYFDDKDKEFISKVFRAASGEQGVFGGKSDADTSDSKEEVKKVEDTPVEQKQESLDSKDDLLNI